VLTRRRIFGPLMAALVALGAVLALALTSGAPLVSGTSPHVIWLSPQAFVAGQNIAGGHLTLSSPSGDEQQVTTDQVGDLQWVVYPLQLSNQSKIRQVITCYKLDSANSFISQVRLARSKIPPTATVVYDDGTDLKSTAGACHNGKVVSGISISGEITLSLRLNFAATSNAIDIGAIGLVVTP
jgi:hypothetical protein